MVLNVPCPILVVPSEKITVPLGLAAPVLPGLVTDTVTVNVTFCPDTDGLTEDATVVLVLAWLTVSVSDAALLRKLLSPA